MEDQKILPRRLLIASNVRGRRHRTSNGCRDTRECLAGGRPLRRPVGTHGLCVRCVKGYRVVVLTGTDALSLDTIRASLHRLHVVGRLCQTDTSSVVDKTKRRPVGTHGLCVRCSTAGRLALSTTDAQTERPYSRYTSRFDTTDAQTERPYSGYTSCCTTTDAQTVRPYSRYMSCVRCVKPIRHPLSTKQNVAL